MTRLARGRHRITIQQRGTAQDAIGQRVETWTDYGHATASVQPVRGRSYFAASGEHADVTHTVTFRGQKAMAITPAHRVLFGTRTFDIKSVINPDEIGAEIQLMCTEQVAV